MSGVLLWKCLPVRINFISLTASFLKSFLGEKKITQSLGQGDGSEDLHARSLVLKSSNFPRRGPPDWRANLGAPEPFYFWAVSALFFYFFLLLVWAENPPCFLTYIFMVPISAPVAKITIFCHFRTFPLFLKNTRTAERLFFLPCDDILITSTHNHFASKEGSG